MKTESILVRVVETKTVVTETVWQVQAKREPGDMHRRSPRVNKTGRYRNGLADRAEKMAMAGKGKKLHELKSQVVKRSIPLHEIPGKPVVCFDSPLTRERMIAAVHRKSVF